MTTAALTAAVPAPPVADLHAENETLRRQLAAIARDLTSARVRNSTLVAALRRAVEAPVIVGQSAVGSMLTITYSSGRVLQLQPVAEYTERSTEYLSRWTDLTPAPDTPHALVSAVLGDDDLDATPFLGGMAVCS
jgi:hypothetical protein